VLVKDYSLEDTSMRRLNYLVAVFGLVAAAASAQPPGPPPGHRGPLDIESLTVLLDLDAYQKGEVERILKEQREAMRGQRANHAESDERPSFEEMQARREQNRQALLGQLQNVLTEQQLTKFKLLMPQPRGDGPHGRPPASPPL
jgi:hypothetical protein